MGTEPAKKKKRSKNKFKPNAPPGQAAPSSSAPALHVTAASGSKKRNKRKAKQGGPAVDDTVAVQHDAPGALQQHQQRAAAPPPRAAAAAPPAGGPRALAPPAAGGKGKKGKGSLLDQMRQRLQGGRFRWLNEALYTTGGEQALAMMRREPELMEQYHEGFREQTKGWPAQPVDQAIRWLRGRPAAWVVADLGCGDAKIAATVQQKVHSFDLAATAPGVVACNMAALPLPGASVDAAVFCLSLMGTDYGAFIQEAARVLKPEGWLWIAEVQSRFVADGGGGGGGAQRSVLPAFLDALGALGFAVRRKDTSNSHFLVLELQRKAAKTGKGGGGGGGQRAPQWPPLRPCQYKKR